ncbi:UDP-4-amino-4,6-dideoxy-N-acetyl-beta-L-altrosamine transaminase [Crateriforma spongiae]|uniref:UDP-4-amino-4, 6-dideoxy-N-acetyl-beta-L-altrosamine transaminase n=1 Tax=Crateriforma spongiae TaxID=2724528 RepID=UPI0039AF981C
MIPYGKQSIAPEDIEAVVQAIQSDFLTQGPWIGEFEDKVAQRCGSRHAVACNSGTAALHIAYAALGIRPGSIVVVPANTFLATANAAVYLGAEVRFCDVDPLTGLMTPERLASVLDTDVSLVVPVHFAGMACDMQAIRDCVDQFAPDARIVEDASHAIGAVHPDGSPVGSLKWSDLATFSFHPVKHVAAGEGGAVTVDDTKLFESLTRYRCHGMTKDPDLLTRPDEGPWYYEMHELGYNYRIPEASCALASSQMNRLDDFVARRREIAAIYLDKLAGLEAIHLPAASQLPLSSWHLFCVHADFDTMAVDRIGWMKMLRQFGVGTQVHYFPVCSQPYYLQHSPGDAPRCTGAWHHYNRALSLPMFPAMTDADVQTVCDAVIDVHSHAIHRDRRAA